MVEHPSEEAVAKRALCLAAFVMRGDFESVFQDISDPRVRDVQEKMTEELGRWISEEGLAVSQSDNEKLLFSKPLGAWDRQDSTNAGWRTESLGTLLWALSFFEELPPYDEGFDQKVVITQVGIGKPMEDFLRKARLRERWEIDRARDVAELWHWRSRTTQIQEEGVKPPKLTFPQIIKIAAEEAYKEESIPKPIENDFPVFGKSYKDLSEEEYAEVSSIAVERHFALNWLSGYSQNWDEIPTDT